MTEKDQVKPYHAKEPPRGQEAADAVADVLKHAAARDEAAKKKTPPKSQPKWMLPLAMNLGVLAVFFLVAQPDFAVVSPIQAPAADEQIERLRGAIYAFGIVKIDAYIASNGRAPGTLQEAGADRLVGQVDYTPRGDSTYVLFATVGTQDLVFDSSVDSVEEFISNLATRLGG
jgi:hypothetical protein